MADEAIAVAVPASAQAAPAAASPATPAPVDPRAAALELFKLGDTAPKGPTDAGTAAPASTEAPVSPEAAAPKVEPKPQDERLSSGFAKLARDKAAVLGREQAIAKAEGDLKTYNELRAKIAADPAAVLDLLGAASAQEALERVAEAYMARNGTAPTVTAEDRVAALERQAAERDAAAAAERETHQEGVRRLAVEQALGIVKRTLEAADVAPQFQTINRLGEHQQVFDALSKYVVLHKVPQAQVTTELVKLVAAGVEKALDEDISGLVGKVPHIAARVTPPREQQAPTGHQTASGAQGNSSSSLAGSSVNGAPPHQPARRLTNDELRAKALALFKVPAQA